MLKPLVLIFALAKKIRKQKKKEAIETVAEDMPEPVPTPVPESEASEGDLEEAKGSELKLTDQWWCGICKRLVTETLKEHKKTRSHIRRAQEEKRKHEFPTNLPNLRGFSKLSGDLYGEEKPEEKQKEKREEKPQKKQYAKHEEEQEEKREEKQDETQERKMSCKKQNKKT